jgi:TRAP-type uncharacterized transport system fused permease subunit
VRRLSGPVGWSVAAWAAVLSDLTPPDAVTAFAAANIAGSDMMTTGIEAFRLGVAGFLVPFAFVFHPELLLNGSATDVALMSGCAAVSAVALAAGVVGHAGGPLRPWERALAVTASGLLIGREAVWQLTGFVVFAAIVAWSTRRPDPRKGAAA